ncbi:MAG: ATP-binding cassette domain-containing protein [Desulfobacterales bacterium]|nr:ATP-binding cassette domain-containing protein [Desulfobacterales bacterium]
MHQSNSQQPIIEIHDLKTWFPIRKGFFSKIQGHIKAVDGVSFRINKGETLGLVGESGCGKTTLGRTLVGLEKEKEGTAFFEGNNLFTMKHSDKKRVRPKIQMIFQDPLNSLNPRMNVLDIITEGLVYYNRIEDSREAHAIRLLNQVGLSAEALYRYPHEFSGGQCQRISIARAISIHPDFIVCDEVVSALDVSVQAQIINLLRDLQETYQLSYLFISHNLCVVSHIAHNVCVMYLGKVMEYGPVTEVIDHPKHPYTQALISAVPVPGMNSERILLKGDIPSPSNPPSGCRFHTRCPKAFSVCQKNSPDSCVIENSTVWCHLYK